MHIWDWNRATRHVVDDYKRGMGDRVKGGMEHLSSEFLHNSLFKVRSSLTVFTARPIDHPFQGSAMKAANIFGKSGVPNPVTGSQPGAVGNPSVEQPGLDPSVMS